MTPDWPVLQRRTAEVRGQSGTVNHHALLHPREQKAVEAYLIKYRKKFNRSPESDRDLFCYLGDNPENRVTWSAISKKLPTFRVGRGLHWNPKAKRWLTAREKLASLGFPCDLASSDAMGVPEIPIKCNKRASAVAGNAMHFGSVAIAQLLALCCFAKVED